MGRKRNAPLNKLFVWVRRQSTKVKTFLAVAVVLFALVALKLLIHDHNHFFVASEATHFAGILVLIYKLTTQKTCSGLSLKTQELTAIFVGARLCCSLFMEGDIHTFLDFVTLVSTLWVIYMIRFKLKSTYIVELDNMPIYYVMVEPFTANYVFALGVARFLGCAHWIINVYDSAGEYLFLVGAGYIWLPMVLLAEIVQTFILADFCYYYIKSVMNGQLHVQLPLPV
ncbi:er lumen protein-retaining receptor [Phtheirospermum japonicum]|uniref:Er lumen protein-retaining receptor n=1 Tax=Phtheirospermum japonicum TaxID=374723 RepID=A0A830CE38_9LAMI|nr:er lumen protein-retaining receptor [Phtheirospermum japonicum]